MNGTTPGAVRRAVHGSQAEVIEPGLADGEYDVHYFLTWSGKYLDPIPAISSGGLLALQVPEARPRDGKPRYFGSDVAFKIVRRSEKLNAN